MGAEPSRSFAVIAGALPEPHLLVTGGGRIVAANGAAVSLLGLDGTAEPLLQQRVTDPPERVARFLEHCARSRSMILGALSVPNGSGGAERRRCEGAVLEPRRDEKPAIILLRFAGGANLSERFLLLNRQIDELRHEIRRRQAAEARLADALNREVAARQEIERQALELEESQLELETSNDELRAAMDALVARSAELEAARAHAEEANRAKGDFLATMSHELRTPLNAILGYADLLLAGIAGDVTAAQRQQLERIKVSGRHLLQLIEQILTLTRTEAGTEPLHLDAFDLCEVAREAASLVEPSAAGKGLALVVEVPTEPCPVFSDATKVRQVLLNLLSNAVKFTGEGAVTLRVELRPERVLLTVEDTGIGIAPQHQQRVFEAFWQVERSRARRPEGAGLGLAVTRHIVELLGGEIRLASELGKGTKITVELPRRDP